MQPMSRVMLRNGQNSQFELVIQILFMPSIGRSHTSIICIYTHVLHGISKKSLHIENQEALALVYHFTRRIQHYIAYGI